MNITTKKERQNMKALNRQAKALLIALAVAAFLPLSSLPMMALDANAVPELNKSINGGYVGTNATDANKFDVNMATGLGAGGVAQFDWNKFNVGSNKTVDFIFTGTSQTAINRVINGGGISEIYGKMTSSASNGCPSCAGTGKVILINPNGITFGQNSTVNINAFTASTQDIVGMRNIEKVLGTTDATSPYYGLTANGTNNYTAGDLFKSKFGYTSALTFDRASTLGQINPDGNGTINYNPIIKANGASFNIENGVNKDTNAKSLAFVGNTVDIKNSLLRTTTPDNGGHSLSPYNRSDIKIITADGVTFKYQNWGDIKAVDTTTIKASTVGDGLTIKNSMVESGGILMENNIKGKDINITDTNVISTKLDNTTTGSMRIEAAQGNVNITRSNLATTTQSGGKDSENLYGKTLTFGNMDIIAGKVTNADGTTTGKSVVITDSKLQTADSDLNNTKVENGNINITAGGQIIVNNTTDNNSTINTAKGEKNSIIAGGNLTMQAGKEIKIDLGDKTSGRRIVAQGIDGISNNVKDRTVTINGQAVEIKNAVVSGGKVDVWAGRGNSASNDGVLKVTDSSIHGYGDVLLRGYITTLKDSLIAYNTLTLDNGYNSTNIPSSLSAYPWAFANDVEIIGSTTFYDNMVETGAKDTLVLATNGQLILTNATLQKQGFSENAAPTDTNTQRKNQTANIQLDSKYSQVSIREGSDITTNENITLNGHTNASVSQSRVTSNNGNITMNAGTKVTIGNLDRNGNIGNGSTLTAKNIDLNVAKNTNLVTDHLDPSWDVNNPNGYLGEGHYGITILDSNLIANNGSTTAKVWKDGGVIALKSTDITSSQNNVIYNEGGKISIEGRDTNNATTYADVSNITAQNGTNLIKSNGSDHVKDYVYIDDSRVTSKGNTEIVSAGSDVDVRFSIVNSTNGDVYLTQYNNALIDGANPTLIRDWTQILAGNNVYLTVTGAGNSLEIRGLDDFTYGNRIIMEANKNVDLTSENDWNLVKADLIADNGWTSIGSSGLVNLNDVSVKGATNKIEAATGDISITNNLNIKNGTTSIKSFAGTVKSTGNGATDNYTNGTIVANNNKVKIDAAKDVKVAISKAAQGGLEVNGLNQSSELSGKTVSIALAGDENLGISRIKAGNLNFLETDGTALKQSNWKKLTAASNTISTANNDKIIANGYTVATDNLASTQVVQPNNTAGYAGKAYIEVANRNGFNLDSNTSLATLLPNFYDNADHFDLVAGTENEFTKHFINFQTTPTDGQISTASTLLVYNREVNCPVVPEPEDPTGPVINNSPIGLDESTFVRMPRHEEGVSLVAPVQNAITDPTANVIMAAARIDVTGTSEEDEDEYSF